MDLVQPYSTFNTSLPILLARCVVLVPNSVFCWFNVLSSFQVFDPTCCLQVICVTLLQPDMSFSCHGSYLGWSFWLPGLDYGVVSQRVLDHVLTNFIISWSLDSSLFCALNLFFFRLFQFRTWHLLPDRLHYSQGGPNHPCPLVLRPHQFPVRMLLRHFRGGQDFKKNEVHHSFFYFWEASQWDG